MAGFSFVTVDQVDESKLDDFLCKVYSKPKSEFLCFHGNWWHRGAENRWAILADNEIAAYCAVIPTNCFINGIREPVLCWVDLIVAPEFRGRGLQTLLDQEIRKRMEVKLGFPNELAAEIHQKHGWSVREDFQIMMAPLRPLGVKNVRAAAGFRGSLLRAGSVGLIPVINVLKQSLLRYTPINAQAIEAPSADVFAEVFERNKKDTTATTYRDEDYIRWRYLDAPYTSELGFYVAGPFSSPTHFLVARHVSFQGVKTTRILDLFGDFSDLAGLKDILKLAVKDAILQGSNQVTVFVTLWQLQSVLRSIGFLIRAKVRFCWHSRSEAIMQSLGGPGYWTLADSDNDASE